MDRAGNSGTGLQVLYDVATTLTSARTAEQAAAKVLAAIGRGLGWHLAALWQVDPSSQTLRAVATWSTDETANLEAGFTRSIARGETCLGKAWVNGHPCWLEDSALEMDTPGVELAASAEMRSMLVHPIAGTRGVVGVLQLFRRDPWPPDVDASRALDVLSCQIAQAFERTLAERALAKAEDAHRVELEKLATRTGDLQRELAIGSKLQAALRDSQAKLRRLYESDIIGIMIADTRGQVTEANDAVLRMLGYTREDVETGTLRWDRLTPPEWSERDLEAVQQVTQFGWVGTYEKEYFHRDGSRVPLLLGATLLEGSRTECICVILDNTARKHAEEAVARLNEDLERRVDERTDSLRASEARAAETARALARSEQQLRVLAAHVEKVREGERGRLAREIHDVLGQELTGLKMDVAWVVRRLTESDANGEKVLERLQQMLRQIDSTIGIVRRISTELRPAALDLGLTAAMEWQAREFQARSGITVEFSSPADDLVIDQGRATAVFRIFQELLTNVARHSGARRVRAELGADDNSVVLDVEDDGKGIAESEVSSPSSLGLLGVRERALVFGGECSFIGTPGRGTHAHVFIPLGGSSEPEPISVRS